MGCGVASPFPAPTPKVTGCLKDWEKAQSQCGNTYWKPTWTMSRQQSNKNTTHTHTLCERKRCVYTIIIHVYIDIYYIYTNNYKYVYILYTIHIIFYIIETLVKKTPLYPLTSPVVVVISCPYHTSSWVSSELFLTTKKTSLQDKTSAWILSV